MMSKQKQLIPVSLRAAVQRINRHLEKIDQKMCKSRPGRSQHTLGDYYVVDVRSNFLVESDIDPELYGRELKVIKGYETVLDVE